MLLVLECECGKYGLYAARSSVTIIDDYPYSKWGIVVLQRRKKSSIPVQKVGNRLHKYMSLFHELETGIKSGLYRQGAKLPSIRELAEQYSCSKSTVLAAVEELERRHMIYSVPRSGYYVVERPDREGKKGESLIDFATSAPDPELFPYLDFQHCINRAIDLYKNDLFIYGTASGLPTLLSVMRKQLAEAQVFTQERNMVITSGIQMALAVLVTIPFPNGKQTILMEQPGYHLLIEYFNLHQLPVLGIYRNAAGIDLEQLEELFRTKDIKFFYTIPRFHSPLGSSYTEQQKKAILELAHRYDVYIVEDDHMADLELNSKADPMYAYDRNERVIYLKSFSKIIFPGLRIGVTVLPESLLDVFIRYKRGLDIDSSMLSQGALEIYLKSGMFARHRDKLRESYASRAKMLHDVLRKELEISDDAFRYPDMDLKYSGIHTHLIVNERISVPGVIEQLKLRNVLLERMDKHFLPGYNQKHLLKLNVSNVEEEGIEAGIQQLTAVLRSELRKHRVKG